MNDKDYHSNQYSASDIQRYLKGEMSTEEMHAIEKAALDDPFLADAIEGYQNVVAEGREKSVAFALEDLNKKFDERTRPAARVVPIRYSKWWQISAAAVILVIIGVAIYNNQLSLDKPTDQKLAATEKKEADSSSPSKAEDKLSTFSPPTDTQRSQDAKPVKPAPGSVAKEQAPAPVARQHNNSAPKKTTAQKSSRSIPKEDERTDDENKDVAVKAKQEPAASPIVSNDTNRFRQPDAVSASTEVLARKNNQLAEQLNNFSGRVVDPTNKPLPHANVQVIQNKTSFVTDQSGNFNFAVKDSIVDVQVALVGFEQRNFRLQNSIAANNLVLEPSKSDLNEVVVSGYGKKRQNDVSKSTVKVQDAVPEIGWIEYEKYLEKNKKLTPETPPLYGQVSISFQVDEKALLSDFRIEKSLSPQHDKEAIRLIKEGPAWKLSNGNKTRITVIVKF